jgi:hypothetical protein
MLCLNVLLAVLGSSLSCHCFVEGTSELVTCIVLLQKYRHRIARVAKVTNTTDSTLQKVVNYVVNKWNYTVHVVRVPRGGVVSVAYAASGNDRIFDLGILHVRSVLALPCTVPQNFKPLW